VSGGATEIELKLAVDDAAALERIARAAGGAADAVTVAQTNHFFDTADRALDRGRFVLRLRAEDADWYLTAKGSTVTSAGGALKRSLEEELQIDDATARALLAGTASPLDRLDDRSSSTRDALVAALRDAVGAAPLTTIGSFTNRRTKLPTTLSVHGAPLPVVLELDTTTFPGGVVHHEVEVELTEGTDAAAAERALRDLLARAGVVGRPAPGKSKRFFAALRGERI
jgi:uncharacterized protein YjbK